MLNPRTRLALPLLLAALAAPAFALEGAETSRHPDWKGVPAHPQPDAATRQRERSDRQDAIEADIARLQQRLTRVPAPAKMAELHARLEAIDRAYGWVPGHAMVYGRRSIEPMLKGQDTVPRNLLDAFIQFDRDLKARGIDLVILPLAPTPHFHSHLLIDGIDADDEYYPGWTEMVIEMLEADLEVVDTVSAFRAEAGNPVLVSFANDFHTGSTGRAIAAKALAERLQRYAWARELKGNRGLWTETVKEKTGASFPQRIAVVNGAVTEINRGAARPGQKTWPRKHPGKLAVMEDDAPADMPEALANRTFRYLDLDADPEVADLKRTELVMIGDSQLHSAVYGSGFPEFIKREVGGRFRWGSKSWSGFSPPEIYREVVPDAAVQPRVVVLTFLPKYFWHRYDRKGNIDEEANTYKPRPLPPVKTAAAAAADADAAPSDPFAATVKVTQVSKQRNPKVLSYDEAITHTAATVVEGPPPLVGKTVAVRYWTMADRTNLKKPAAVKPGQTLDLTLQDWMAVIEAKPKLAEHMVFDDTDLDLTAAVFWVTAGPLSADDLGVKVPDS